MSMQGPTLILSLCAAALLPAGQAMAQVTADPAGTLFRLDGGGVTYAIGVDAKGYVQPLYWGPSLAGADPLSARAAGELSGFDPAGSVTPQEYPG